MARPKFGRAVFLRGLNHAKVPLRLERRRKFQQHKKWEKIMTDSPLSEEEQLAQEKINEVLARIGFGKTGELPFRRCHAAKLAKRTSSLKGRYFCWKSARKYGYPNLPPRDHEWFVQTWLPLLLKTLDSIYAFDHESRCSAFDHYDRVIEFRRSEHMEVDIASTEFWYSMEKQATMPSGRFACCANAWALQRKEINANSDCVVRLANALLETKSATADAVIQLIEAYLRTVLGEKPSSKEYSWGEVSFLSLSIPDMAPTKTHLKETEEIKDIHILDVLIRLQIEPGLRLVEVLERALLLASRTADADLVAEKFGEAQVLKGAISIFFSDGKKYKRPIKDIYSLANYTINHIRYSSVAIPAIELLHVFEKQFFTEGIEIGTRDWQERVGGRHQFLFAQNESLGCQYFCLYAEYLLDCGQVQHAEFLLSFYIHIARLAANLTPLTSEPSNDCLLYTSPSPRDRTRSRMPSSA